MRSTLPHRRLWLQAAASLVAATTLPAGAQVRPKPTVDSAGYTEIRWDDLVPKGWDPTQLLKDKGGGNLAALQDGDPKAAALLQQLREVWDNAPTEPELNNSRIKLPGYLVPLDESAAGITEFLLVPYFGACIHTPPPPANQIVLVRPARPLTGYRTMDTVWASGRLRTSRSQSQMGTSGYTLEAALIDRYVAAPR